MLTTPEPARGSNIWKYRSIKQKTKKKILCNEIRQRCPETQRCLVSRTNISQAATQQISEVQQPPCDGHDKPGKAVWEMSTSSNDNILWHWISLYNQPFVNATKHILEANYQAKLLSYNAVDMQLPQVIQFTAVKTESKHKNITYRQHRCRNYNQQQKLCKHRYSMHVNSIKSLHSCLSVTLSIAMSSHLLQNKNHWKKKHKIKQNLKTCTIIASYSILTKKMSSR